VVADFVGRISSMASKLQLSSLIPAGLVVESIAESDEKITVIVRSAVQEKACPLCGRYSRRVHSRYVRTITDLPWAGKKVELHLFARRFFCEASLCRRRIFAERFQHDVVAERSAAHRVSSILFIIWDWPEDLPDVAVRPLQEDGIGLRDLDRALQQLSPEHREVLLLISLEDLSYEEAATITGTPVGTIMSRLSRARERLRQLLAGQPATPEYLKVVK
jgi:RNA polymerase sigma factor (sigma-70 family)